MYPQSIISNISFAPWQSTGELLIPNTTSQVWLHSSMRSVVHSQPELMKEQEISVIFRSFHDFRVFGSKESIIMRLYLRSNNAIFPISSDEPFYCIVSISFWKGYTLDNMLVNKSRSSYNLWMCHGVFGDIGEIGLFDTTIGWFIAIGYTFCERIVAILWFSKMSFNILYFIYISFCKGFFFEEKLYNVCRVLTTDIWRFIIPTWSDEKELQSCIPSVPRFPMHDDREILRGFWWIIIGTREGIVSWGKITFSKSISDKGKIIWDKSISTRVVKITSIPWMECNSPGENFRNLFLITILLDSSKSDLEGFFAYTYIFRCETDTIWVKWRSEEEGKCITPCEVRMEPRNGIKKWRRIVYIHPISNIVCYVLDEIDPEHICIGCRMSSIKDSHRFFLGLEFWMETSIVPEALVFSIEISCIDSIEWKKWSSKSYEKKNSIYVRMECSSISHRCSIIFQFHLQKDHLPMFLNSWVSLMISLRLQLLQYRR